jgi:hypothetical protein
VLELMARAAGVVLHLGGLLELFDYIIESVM